MASNSVRKPANPDDTRDWVALTPATGYDKDFYEVRLPNGEIITSCWPNAGRFNATGGDVTGSWGEEDGVYIREDRENWIGG